MQTRKSSISIVNFGTMILEKKVYIITNNTSYKQESLQLSCRLCCVCIMKQSFEKQLQCYFLLQDGVALYIGGDRW